MLISEIFLCPPRWEDLCALSHAAVKASCHPVQSNTHVNEGLWSKGRRISGNPPQSVSLSKRTGEGKKDKEEKRNEFLMNKDFSVFGYTLGISGERKTLHYPQDNFLLRLTRKKWAFSDGDEDEKGLMMLSGRPRDRWRTVWMPSGSVVPYEGATGKKEAAGNLPKSRFRSSGTGLYEHPYNAYPLSRESPPVKQTQLHAAGMNTNMTEEIKLPKPSSPSKPVCNWFINARGGGFSPEMLRKDGKDPNQFISRKVARLAASFSDSSSPETQPAASTEEAMTSVLHLQPNPPCGVLGRRCPLRTLSTSRPLPGSCPPPLCHLSTTVTACRPARQPPTHPHGNELRQGSCRGCCSRRGRCSGARMKGWAASAPIPPPSSSRRGMEGLSPPQWYSTPLPHPPGLTQDFRLPAPGGRGLKQAAGSGHKPVASLLKGESDRRGRGNKTDFVSSPGYELL
ncbi:homeobox protein TGIF1 [Lates japonicus]|uniref:Homeobox protein TGIF1 n=1 Tax=Lates japonicus TaxID=270547 RepID=A0AAD3QZ45_LATJO|nr:homeobox protein TGIF1 [Lates japonicus]